MDANEQIQEAKRRLLAGGLVAFPTETVYGLGALALDPLAVARVFAAKGRPANNPLIVHVSGAAMARSLVAPGTWDDRAERLARAFWPGPLTLVLPKAAAVPSIVTGGGPNVALRSPDHPLTLALLFDLNQPIVGPSANRSGHVSPTTAEHVRCEFPVSAAREATDGGRGCGDVDEVWILQTREPARVGVESTVLSLVGQAPRVLRPGVISPQQIAAVLGVSPVSIEVGAAQHGGSAPASPSQAIEAPGMLDRHYAPRTPARLVERTAIREALDHAQSGRGAGGRCRSFVVMGFAPALSELAKGSEASDGGSGGGSGWIEMPSDPAEYAASLYAGLRRADALAESRGVSEIMIESPPLPAAGKGALSPEDWLWTVIADRLRRATSP